MEAAKLRFGLHRSCDPREMRHRPAAARQHHRRRYLANLVVCYWPSHCRPKRRARPEGRQFNGPHFFLNELYVGHDFHDARALLLGWREQIPGLRAGRWSPRKALIATAYLQFRETWRGPARSAWQALRTVSDRHPPTPVTVSWCVRQHHAVGLV